MADYREIQAEAAARVTAELAKPCPQNDMDIGDEFFDPWALFPCLYGSYSSSFDDMALEVLEALRLANERKWDKCNALQRKETLAHEMFREMLCTADLCDYGTSPRVCFANHDTFAPLLPQLIEKWREYYKARWDKQDG